jgi:hypothetical protein
LELYLAHTLRSLMPHHYWWYTTTGKSKKQKLLNSHRSDGEHVGYKASYQ